MLFPRSSSIAWRRSPGVKQGAWCMAYLPGSTRIKGSMKYTSFSLSFLVAACLLAQELKAQALPKTAPNFQAQAVHLATALDHLTVLEFGEPVTQAAAGSTAFNIEW